MTTEITISDPIKQGETKTLNFTISGTTSLAGATFTFALKKSKSNSAYLVEEAGTEGGAVGNWDFTDLANRVVSLPLVATDTDQPPGAYLGELKIVFAGGAIEKSVDINLTIGESVFHD